VRLRTGAPGAAPWGDRGMEVRAEVIGSLWRIVVEVSQRVEEDETILVLESMKMEIPVTSPIGGTVTAILASRGEVVQEGQTVAIVE